MPVAPNSLLTRLLLVSFGVLSLVLASPQARAEDKVLRVGTLKLIHGITPYFYEKFAPPGYKVEVVPFESPTDGKNAVVAGSVDFGICGLAAATLGAAAHLSHLWRFCKLHDADVWRHAKDVGRCSTAFAFGRQRSAVASCDLLLISEFGSGSVGRSQAMPAPYSKASALNIDKLGGGLVV
jgi:hypothetical protein